MDTNTKKLRKLRKVDEVNTTSKNIDERWQSLSPLPDTTSPEDWDFVTEVTDNEIGEVIK